MRSWSRRTAGVASASRSMSLRDTGVFDEDRYFDVFAEYAKASPDDILIRITIANRGPEAAALHLLPTLWFRNSWTWGCTHEGCDAQAAADGRRAQRRSSPSIRRSAAFRFVAEPRVTAYAGAARSPTTRRIVERLFGVRKPHALCEGCVPRTSCHGKADAVNPALLGTKAAAHYQLTIPAGGRGDDQAAARRGGGKRRRCRSARSSIGSSQQRIAEADEFYDHEAARRRPAEQTAGRPPGVRRAALEQAVLSLRGERLARRAIPTQPPPPPQRARAGATPTGGISSPATCISMPDKWEYPWFAAWDLAFHMIAVGVRSIRSSPRSSCCCCCASGTCIPTGRCRRTSLPSATSTRRCTPGRAGASTRSPAAAGERDRAVSRARVPEAADQLHLVGEPQGRRRARTSSPAASSGWTTSASSTAPSRCPAAAGWSRPTAPRGWRSTAPPCSRWRWSWRRTIRRTKTSPPSSSSIRRHHRRDEHPGRHRPVGRGGRLLLRPAHWSTARRIPLRVRSMVGIIPLFAVRGARDGDDRQAARVPEADALVPRASPGPGPPHLLHGEGHGERARRTTCWPSPRASGSSACCATCWTKPNFSPPFGVRSLSRVHKDHPYVVRGRRASSTASTTSRANPTPRCSAATPTGAARSGSRSTTC